MEKIYKKTEMLGQLTPFKDSSLPALRKTSSEVVTGAVRCQRRVEFDHLLPHLLPRLRRMAMRWLHNPEDAEDAVQDAMLSAFRHLANFDGRSQMSTWLTTILRNAVWMQIRRRARRPTVGLGENSEVGQLGVLETLADPRPSPEQTLEQRQLRKLLRKLASGLPRSQQAALNLHIRGNLSVKEMAESLGAPEGTVKSQLARGRANLAKRFHKALVTPRLAMVGCCGTKKLGSDSSWRPQNGTHDALGLKVLNMGQAAGYEVWNESRETCST